MYGKANRRFGAARIARGISARARSLLPYRPRPAIMMYHRIAHDGFDPWGLAVAPDRFAEQLAWLSANRTVIALDEFAARQRDRSLPADAIAVTFDDGYACSGTVAAPMLEQQGMPATIFLPIELIERGETFWWDELQELVLRAEAGSLSLGDTVVQLGEKCDDDSLWLPGRPPRTERQTAFQRLWAMLRPLAPGPLTQAMRELRGQASAANRPAGSKRPMSPSEVRATASGRIAFGSHALTHPWLSSLARSEKASEIIDSKQRCEALTGSPSTSFAYPYGNFDQESEQLVQQAGFRCACSTVSSAVGAKSRPFALPRIQVGNWDAGSLKRALGSIARG